MYNNCLCDSFLNWIQSVAASRGDMGANAPQSEALPPPLAPQSEEKNGQNQPFSANFWIFAPSESHFAPSVPPPHKKISGAATGSNIHLKSPSVLLMVQSSILINCLVVSAIFV